MSEGSDSGISRDFIGASQPEVMGDKEAGLTAVIDGRYEVKCVSFPRYEVKDDLIGDRGSNEWRVKVSDLKAPSESPERKILDYGFAPDDTLDKQDAARIHRDVVRYVEGRIANGASIKAEGLRAEVGKAVGRLYKIPEEEL